MAMLKINGVEREFPDGELPETVADLLIVLEICAATVVAEVDGRVVEMKDFADTKIQAGQSIELIRFVGGG